MLENYTCEDIKTIMFALFFIAGFFVFTGILISHAYCNRNNIEINKLSGVFKMTRQVYGFRNKVFSIVSLAISGGGALVATLYIMFTLLAQNHDCVYGG